MAKKTKNGAEKMGAKAPRSDIEGKIKAKAAKMGIDPEKVIVASVPVCKCSPAQAKASNEAIKAEAAKIKAEAAKPEPVKAPSGVVGDWVALGQALIKAERSKGAQDRTAAKEAVARASVGHVLGMVAQCAAMIDKEPEKAKAYLDLMADAIKVNEITHGKPESVKPCRGAWCVVGGGLVGEVIEIKGRNVRVRTIQGNEGNYPTSHIKGVARVDGWIEDTVQEAARSERSEQRAKDDILFSALAAISCDVEHGKAKPEAANIEAAKEAAKAASVEAVAYALAQAAKLEADSRKEARTVGKAFVGVLAVQAEAHGIARGIWGKKSKVRKGAFVVVEKPVMPGAEKLIRVCCLVEDTRGEVVTVRDPFAAVPVCEELPVSAIRSYAFADGAKMGAKAPRSDIKGKGKAKAAKKAA